MISMKLETHVKQEHIDEMSILKVGPQVDSLCSLKSDATTGFEPVILKVYVRSSPISPTCP